MYLYHNPRPPEIFFWIRWFVWSILFFSGVANQIVCKKGDVVLRSYESSFGRSQAEKVLIERLHGPIFITRKYLSSGALCKKDKGCLYEDHVDDRKLTKQKKYCKLPKSPEEYEPPAKFIPAPEIQEPEESDEIDNFTDTPQFWIIMMCVVLIVIGLTCIFYQPPDGKMVEQVTRNDNPLFFNNSRAFRDRARITASTIFRRSQTAHIWSAFRSTKDKFFVKNFGTVIKPSAKYQPRMVQPHNLPKVPVQPGPNEWRRPDRNRINHYSDQPRGRYKNSKDTAPAVCNRPSSTTGRGARYGGRNFGEVEPRTGKESGTILIAHVPRNPMKPTFDHNVNPHVHYTQRRSEGERRLRAGLQELQYNVFDGMAQFASRPVSTHQQVRHPSRGHSRQSNYHGSQITAAPQRIVVKPREMKVYDLEEDVYPIREMATFK